MNFFELAFVILVLYLLYKLVFNVVVPVSKATSTVRDRMRQMQEEQTRNSQPQKNSYTSPAAKKHDSTTTDSEYIDYEEVK